MLTRFYQISSLDVQHLAQSLEDAQQMIVHRVMDAIDRLIHEHHPEVQWSDAPKGV